MRQRLGMGMAGTVMRTRLWMASLHTVQVIATNLASDGTTVQDGPASASRTATPKPATVAAAPTVTVHADPGKLTVKWEKVEGATRYKVEWRDVGW